VGLLLSISLASTAQERCGSVFNAELIRTTDPERYARFMAHEQRIADNIRSLKNGGKAERLINPNSIIIIPVVVHVLHFGEAVGVGNNISDAQVQSQITVLNDDFRRNNWDAVNTPAAFAGVAADARIEFRLTCVDPNGNPTNGIHRVQTATNPFTVQFSGNSINEQATGIKFTAQGGTDAWPTDRYLNIWVCNIAPNPGPGGGQLTGYGQFPADYASKPNTDGIVVLNTAFGTVGNVNFLTDLGRTATHEVGHWLDLFHIWGDDGGACGGTDNCNDTPNQAGANQSNCPGFPNISCGNNPNGDMFMNYMDYTLDFCKNIFTQDQVNRMRAVFMRGGVRAGFIDNYFRINDPTASICNTGTVSVINLSCLPVTWSVVSGPATIIGGQGTNTVNLQSIGTGTVVLSATAGGYTDETTVWMGTPMIGSNSTLAIWFGNPATDYNDACNLQTTYTDMQVIGASSVVWSRIAASPSNTSWGQNGINLNFYFWAVNQTAVYRITATNACGSSTYDFGFKSIDCNPGGGGGCERYQVAPNPARGGSIKIIVVNIPPPCESRTAGKGKATDTDISQWKITEIKVYDNLGNLKLARKESKTKQANINLAGYKPGIYFVEISDGDYKERQQVIVQ
jgi:hypothetical protein